MQAETQRNACRRSAAKMRRFDRSAQPQHIQISEAANTVRGSACTVRGLSQVRLHKRKATAACGPEVACRKRVDD